MGFPGSSAVKESACNAGDPGSISGSGRSPGDRRGYPPQDSWESLIAQMVKNPPEMQETWVLFPGLGRYPGRGWENPVEISCLENPHGQRNLMGYSPWGHRELDTTERLDTAQQKDPHLRFTKTNKKKVSQVAQW